MRDRGAFDKAGYLCCHERQTPHSAGPIEAIYEHGLDMIFHASPVLNLHDERFQYQALPSSDHIRVIKLLGTQPERLNIALEAAELGTTPYAALSYRWGDPKDTVAIECNRQELEISRSLFDALWTLKDHYGVETIWADQICIDQSNLAEKSKQVQRMHQIYSGATETWAWLGCLNASTSRAIDIIRDRHINDKVNVLDRILSPEKFANTRSEMSDPDQNGERRNLVRNFFAQDWFKRMWIVQEVCLSKEINLACGRRYLEWDEFKTAIESFRARNPNTPDIEPAYNLSQRAQGEDTSVLTTLQDCRNFEATDPRDKVYALQALLPDFKIVPDYTKTVESVYIDAAVAITQGYLEDEDCISPLQLLWTSRHVSRASDKAPSLPSWVPDWRDPFMDSHGDFAYLQANSKVYSRAPPPSISADYRLKARGLRMAKIKEVQNLIAGDGVPTTTGDLSRGLEFVNSRATTLSKDQPDGLPIDFMHTITAGRLHILRNNGSDQESDFAAILEDLIAAGPMRWTDTKLTKRAEIIASNSTGTLRSSALVFTPMLKQTIDSALRGRKLAITFFGELALVPQGAEPGDSIVVLCGCNFPVVLRDVDAIESEHIGLAYLDGVSMGEVTVNALHELDEFVIR